MVAALLLRTSIDDEDQELSRLRATSSASFRFFSEMGPIKEKNTTLMGPSNAIAGTSHCLECDPGPHTLSHKGDAVNLEEARPTWSPLGA